MSVRLLIADSYKIYRDRFAETVHNRMPGAFEITTASSQQDLSAALKHMRYDILLLDPDLYAQDVDLHNVKLVILLTDETVKKNVPEALASYNFIQKYQKITDIVESINQQLSEAPATQAQIQVVFSPSGGAGATTITAALAFQYAKMGKRTLYVNWEAFNSTPLFFECDKTGLSDVFAALRQDMDIKAKIMTLIKEDEYSRVAYLPMLDRLMDKSRISTDEITAFFEALADIGCYDMIVVDAPHTIDEQLLVMFDKADYIFLVAELSETGILKLEMFLSQPYAIEPNKNKMRLIHNKKPNRWSTPKSDIPLLCEIPPLNPAAYREMIENIQQSGLLVPLT